MKTNNLVETLKAAQAARDAAKQRRARNAELRAFFSAGTMVFTGLLLAAIYCVLTHQIPV